MEEATRVLGQPLQREYSLMQWVRRPEVDFKSLMTLTDFDISQIDDIVIQQIEIQARYSGYIERQETEIARNLHYEKATLPSDIDFNQVSGLSNEVIQKLSEHKPHSLGQASRIPGMTPAAISLLRIYLKKRQFHFKETA